MEGWSWWDALVKYAPQDAAAYKAHWDKFVAPYR